MRVLAIPGSTSAKSSNAALLHAARRVAPAGTEMIFFDTAGLPHFNPEHDVDPLPAEVAAFRGLIGEVDAVAICSPEYAHGMPGALKNALDWLVSAVEPIGKPVLLICASPTGAPFAHAQLLEVLRTMMGEHLVDGGAHVFSRHKLDADGRITDPALLAALELGFARLSEACAQAAS